MRRVVLALISTVAGVVLLLNFKVRAVDPAAGTLDVVASGSSRSVTAPKTPGRTAKSTSPKATSKATTRRTTKAAPPKPEPEAAANSTVTGDVADTTFGPVQVKVTFANGKIAAVDAVQAPRDNPTSIQKTTSALPKLETAVIAAQNADVDSVSGATYTSEGYLSSLQSALDKA